MTGGKVVQTNHLLVDIEQGFEQVAADETGNAGDEPGTGRPCQVAFDLLVSGHAITTLFSAPARP